MKEKDCLNCKHLFGSAKKPQCDWFDEPISCIYSPCIKKEEKGNEPEKAMGKNDGKSLFAR